MRGVALASRGIVQPVVTGAELWSHGSRLASVGHIGFNPIGKWHTVTLLEPGVEIKGLNIKHRCIRVLVTGAAGDVMQYVELLYSDN